MLPLLSMLLVKSKLRATNTILQIKLLQDGMSLSVIPITCLIHAIYFNILFFVIKLSILFIWY